MKMLLTAMLASALMFAPVLAAEKIPVNKSSAKTDVAEQVINLKVNINSADVRELIQLKGIGESKALAIIEYRQANGKFSSIEELSNVKGIGSKLVEQNRSNLAL